MALRLCSISMQQNTHPKICLPISSSSLKTLNESELLIKFFKIIILIPFKTKIQFVLTPEVILAASLRLSPLSLNTLQSKPNKLDSNSLQKFSASGFIKHPSTEQTQKNLKSTCKFMTQFFNTEFTNQIHSM